MRIDRGGPVTVVTELVRQQALRGMRVSVATNVGALGAEDRTIAEQRWRGLDVRWMDDRSNALTSFIREGRAETVIHGHGAWDRRTIQACMLAGRLGVPWVLSTHGMLHPRAMARHRWRKELALRFAGPVLLDASRLLVLNAGEAESVLRRTGASPEVMPNGVDESEFRSLDAGAALRALCPALEDRRYVLFVGRLHPIKGTEDLVRSFAHARAKGLGADLILAGPDDGALAATRMAARRARITDHVHFVGRVAGAVRRSAYAGCAVFAHRPIYEGFGLALVEALASGRPVVTTRNCELDGKGAGEFLRWVEDTDEAFGDALAELGNRSKPGPDLAAQDWVRLNYSWTAIADRVLVAYDRVRQATSTR
jgi:glycosyltransferase involved in cell wall biosynthesis